MLPKTPAVTRFGKSFGVGIVTFAFDLALLSIFIDVLHIHYILSAGVAFLIATSTNYFISRRYVFVGSARPVGIGYALFLVIGMVGLVLVASFMYVCVDVLGLHYLVSRFLVATVVGWWNYFMNLYVNFNVAGKENL